MFNGEKICRYCSKTFPWEYYPLEQVGGYSLTIIDEPKPGVARCRQSNSRDDEVMVLGTHCPYCQTPNSFEYTPCKERI
jgi:hypothetical protein